VGRLTLKDRTNRLKKAKQIAKSNRGVLLAEEYLGVDAKYLWRCALGHEWKASYHSVVQRGSWCAVCQGTKKLPSDQLNKAQKIAKYHAGYCLSKKYYRSTDKLKWSCSKGHEWEASFSNISRGKWCPWCAGNKADSKTQLHRAKALAKSKKGELLSSKYSGNKAPMLWQCSEGHKWEASFGTVVNFGSWCGKCGGTLRDKKTQLKKAREFAEKKNGECISQQYVDNSSPMVWQCERGHKWKAAFYSIQSGNWCSICSSSLKERIARDTLEQLFGVPFKKKRPAWLKNPKTKRPMELDGYNSDLGLAFEYQGEQHYFKVRNFAMTNEQLRKSIYRDEIKRKLCRKNGVGLIEIPYNVDSVDFAKYIYQSIKNWKDSSKLLSKMRNWRHVSTKVWVESDKYSIKSLNNYAKSKGGACLSNVYLGALEKYEWRCRKGHIWTTTWDSLNNQNTWCPVCCGNIILNPLSELRELATHKGGKLVTAQFLGMSKRHKWECSEGHQWETKPTHIKYSGSWCPKCAVRGKQKGNFKNSIKTLNQFAISKKGKCISKIYQGWRQKYEWVCDKSHKWFATWESINSKKTWCPVCAKIKRKKHIKKSPTSPVNTAAKRVKD
jgi:hypothetical protein